MPISDSASINALLSTPLVLPAPLAGALAALFLVVVVMAVRRVARGGGVLDLLAMNERAAEQRALLQRGSQLSISAVAPGSPLACLDGVAGEQVENACEQAVFADAQSTARAVAYVSARLSLLSDLFSIAQRGDRDLLAAFTPTRRAIELDRYGIANLKVHAFDAYIARYVSAWGKTEPAAEKQPQASSSALPPVASAGEPQAPHPVDSRYDFPSSASIPPVSIMNAEPPPPKEQTGTANAQAGADKATGTAPVPPKRPQAQAASPPAR